MADVPEDLIMAQTGHKKRDTLDKYIRRTNKWSENAAVRTGDMKSEQIFENINGRVERGSPALSLVKPHIQISSSRLSHKFLAMKALSMS